MLHFAFVKATKKGKIDSWWFEYHITQPSTNGNVYHVYQILTLISKSVKNSKDIEKHMYKPHDFDNIHLEQAPSVMIMTPQHQTLPKNIKYSNFSYLTSSFDAHQTRPVSCRKKES